MNILIIDGQGGQLGGQIIKAIRAEFTEADITAIGTNAVATATMLKAGADFGATGENPVIRNVMDADAVLGPVGIVVAHAILGEVTPAMSEAVGGCRARKYLVPMNSCGVLVAGVKEQSLPDYVAQAVELMKRDLEG